MNISASQARKDWADLLNRVQYGGEHVTVEKHGEPVAVVIPMEAAKFLEEMEDRILAEMADEARRDYDENGGYSLEEVMAEIEAEQT